MKIAKTFTRVDMAVQLAHKLAIPVDTAKGIVDRVISVLIEAVVSGKKIEFRGFGVLEGVDRKPKIGRNPRKPLDGQYQIPARKAVRFRLSKELFNKLNPES